MAFEYYNPHPRKLEITLPFGHSVVVEREGYAPTLEMEKAGITADVLKDFVSKNLLHEVPPEKRDMFLRAREALAAKNIPVAPTVPVVEAPVVGGKAPGSVEKEKPKMSAEDIMRQIRSRVEKSDKPYKSLESSLQDIADASSSSIKTKKPSKD